MPAFVPVSSSAIIYRIYPILVGLSRNYHLSLRVNITSELVQQLRSVKTIAVICR